MPREAGVVSPVIEQISNKSVKYMNTLKFVFIIFTIGSVAGAD